MKSIKRDGYSYDIVESGGKRNKWRMEDYVPYFLDENNSNRDIAMEMGVDESTVGRYRKKWLANQTMLPAVSEVPANVCEASEALDEHAVNEQMQYLFRQHLMREKMRVENDLRKEEIKKRHLEQVLEDDMDWRHYNMPQLNYLTGLTNG